MFFNISLWTLVVFFFNHFESLKFTFLVFKPLHFKKSRLVGFYKIECVYLDVEYLNDYKSLFCNNYKKKKNIQENLVALTHIEE